MTGDAHTCPNRQMSKIPRPTVERDTSQVDDFRDGGVPWTKIRQGGSGRAPRSDRGVDPLRWTVCGLGGFGQAI